MNLQSQHLTSYTIPGTCCFFEWSFGFLKFSVAKVCLGMNVAPTLCALNVRYSLSDTPWIYRGHDRPSLTGFDHSVPYRWTCWCNHLTWGCCIHGLSSAFSAGVDRMVSGHAISVATTERLCRPGWWELNCNVCVVFRYSHSKGWPPVYSINFF